jgi:hypothetical protein
MKKSKVSKTPKIIISHPGFLTRAVRFAVSFPGMRKADLNGEKGLFYQLTVTQSDVRRAANRLIHLIALLDRGMIERPMREDGTGPEYAQTLGYRALNGTWQPFDKPLYDPEAKRLGGGCLSALSEFVRNRYANDKKAVRKDRNRPEYSTFKILPIPIRAQETHIQEDEKEGITISLGLWSRDAGGATRLKVKPVKPNAGQKTILQRLLDGTYSCGGAQLTHHPRKAKWMLSVVYTGLVQQTRGDWIAGVRLDASPYVEIAYTPKTPVPENTPNHEAPRPDTLRVSEVALRAWCQVEEQKRERLHFNRDVYGAREGQGRNGKLKPVSAIQDKHARTVKTALQQTACAVVETAKKRGASVLALGDVQGLARKFLRQTDEMSRRKRAHLRRIRFLHQQPSELYGYIQMAAEREGLAFLKVGPADSALHAALQGREAILQGEIPSVS